MAINFPTNPQPGDQHSTNKKTWQWSGSAWDTLEFVSDYTNNDVGVYLGDLDVSMVPDTNASYDLGSLNNKFRSLYLSDSIQADKITTGTNNATGNNASALGGGGHSATGDNSISLGGINSTASDVRTATLGGNALSATHVGAAAIGGNACLSNGDYSITLGGSANNLTGNYSAIIGGWQNEVTHARSVAIGGTGLVSDASETVFVPSLNIKNSFKMTSGTLNSGYVLTSDANGVGTWQAATPTYDDTPVTALQAASGDWNTAFGWGDHASAGYLTSETSHTDVVVDGDFSSNGLLKRTALGSYTSITDNSSNWNATHSTVQAQSGNWSSSGSTRTFLAIGGVEDTGETSNTAVTTLSSASLVSSNVKNDRCWDSHSNTVHTTDWSGVFTGYDNFRSAGSTPIKTEVKINNPGITSDGTSSTEESWMDVKVVVDWENGNVIGTALYSGGNTADNNSIYVLSATLLTGDNLYTFTRLPTTDTGDGHAIPGIRIHKESYKITAFPRTEVVGSERDNTIGIELVEVY